MEENAEVVENKIIDAPIIDDGVNPNSSSELALLMRAMFNEAEEMKKAVEAGEMPEVAVPYHKITSASATDPAEVETETFKNISKAYIESIERLEAASSPQEARQQYKIVINNCISCHMVACPGPINKIRKLELNEVEI